jgi:import inner membrane translocase subunit TIM23
VPLDPIFTLGGLTIIFAAAGWLVGPSLGAQVFYLLNRQLKPQINQKEAQFFARIRKNRVDPTNSSASNPGTCI